MQKFGRSKYRTFTAGSAAILLVFEVNKTHVALVKKPTKL